MTLEEAEEYLHIQSQPKCLDENTSYAQFYAAGPQFEQSLEINKKR